MTGIENEPFRFHVQGEEKYLVDLEEYHGVGWCGCPDFACRRDKVLEHIRKCPVELEEANALRCKHILLARDYAAELYLDALLFLRRKELHELRRSGFLRSTEA